MAGFLAIRKLLNQVIGLLTVFLRIACAVVAGFLTIRKALNQVIGLLAIFLYPPVPLL